jgi:hypothetical protein
MPCIIASIDFYTITLIPSPIPPVFFRIYYGGDKLHLLSRKNAYCVWLPTPDKNGP